MSRSLQTSQSRLSKREPSQRKLSNFCLQQQNKQCLKAPYFNIVQRIFTQEILQNKKIVIKNSKIKYFFGAIFHGLKRGTIKASLSDFTNNANKVFKAAKMPEIKEIIEEYNRIQEAERQADQPTQKRVQMKSKVNQENFTVNQFCAFNQKKDPIDREAMKQITKLNYDIENRRSRIIQQKQKALEKLGNFANFNGGIKRHDGITVDGYNKYKSIRQGHTAGLISRRTSEVASNQPHVQQDFKSLRNSRRLYPAVFIQQDNKLNELNNRLEYYISLNKQHLMNSKTVRQHCS